MARYKFTVTTIGIVKAKHDIEAKGYLDDVQHYDDIQAEEVETQIKVERIDE